jgi:hypothetical protein
MASYSIFCYFDFLNQELEDTIYNEEEMFNKHGNKIGKVSLITYFDLIHHWGITSLRDLVLPDMYIPHHFKLSNTTPNSIPPTTSRLEINRRYNVPSNAVVFFMQTPGRLPSL